MNFKNIKINKDKNLGILKINRENVNNALDIETSQEILRGLKDIFRITDTCCYSTTD